MDWVALAGLSWDGQCDSLEVGDDGRKVVVRVHLEVFRSIQPSIVDFLVLMSAV